MRNFIRLSDDTMNKVKRLAEKMNMSPEDAILSLVSKIETNDTRFRTHDGWLFIRARYETICPLCFSRVEYGKNVYWKPGQKAIHVECRNKALYSKKRQAYDDDDDCCFGGISLFP